MTSSGGISTPNATISDRPSSSEHRNVIQDEANTTVATPTTLACVPPDDYEAQNPDTYIKGNTLPAVAEYKFKNKYTLSIFFGKPTFL